MQVRLCYYSTRLRFGQKYVAFYCAQRDKNDISASHYPFWVFII